MFCIVNIIFGALVIICAVLSSTYMWFQYQYTYWKKRGVPGPIPIFPEGNFTGVYTKKKHISDPIVSLYPQYKSEPYFGVFSLFKPVLIVNELNIIKEILIKDFDYFTSHGFFQNKEIDPLSEHLFALSGEEWKDLRTKLSPVFTSGKMKLMTSIMADVQLALVQYIDQEVLKSDVINFKSVFQYYTVDVIGNCIFGIECNSFIKPHSDFVKYGKEGILPTKFKEQIGFLLGLVAPEVCELFRWSSQPRDMVAFFNQTVSETVRYREENDIKRNDMMQLLINLKNNELKDDNGIIIASESNFSMQKLISQSFAMFVAGFETSSSAASYAVFHLAQEPDVQRRVRAELHKVLGAGPVSYEALHSLPYLDMVIEETLRLHPALNFHIRKCTKDYTISSTGLKVEKGCLVYIPLIGIQMDPELYPEPDLFLPERFSKEEKAKRHKCAYMPFGEGPRICIGLRFAMMQVRLAIAAVISRYEVSLCEQTALPPVMDKGAIATSPMDMFLQLKALS